MPNLDDMNRTLGQVYEVAQRVDKKLDKHDERIRSLEASRSRLKGALAVVGALGTGAAAVVVKKFTGS